MRQTGCAVDTQAALWAVGCLVFCAFGLVGIGALFVVGHWLGPIWISCLSAAACGVGLLMSALCVSLSAPDSVPCHAAARRAAAALAAMSLALMVTLSVQGPMPRRGSFFGATRFRGEGLRGPRVVRSW